MGEARGKGQGARGKKLRSGFTTGACAAAAAKAAVLLVTRHLSLVTEIEIPFPDGSRHTFKIKGSGVRGQGAAWASVIKDAGDDPDVTNGAEIVAEAMIVPQCHGATKDVGGIHELPLRIDIKGGKGVGIVTKPGLPIPVGEPAINPVPRKMIEEAVREAIKESYESPSPRPSPARSEGVLIEITISVPNGEELAKKTLNSRLGIIGGISILGTTGIVKPVSVEAWTATITSGMAVARAMGQDEIVLSAGRTSEKAHMKKYNFPEELYVLMGDHLEYSLLEAKKQRFKKIHLCAQWAKMLKIAMATPQTHVKFGAIDMNRAVEFLNNFGFRISDFGVKEFNTAREIFDFIHSSLVTCHLSLLKEVCLSAKNYAETISGGVPVTAYLVSYESEIIASSE